MDNIKITSIEVFYRGSEPPYRKLTIKVIKNGEIKSLIIDNHQLNFEDNKTKGFRKHDFLKLIFINLKKVRESEYNIRYSEQTMLYKSENEFIQEHELKFYKSFNYYNFIINKALLS